MLTEAVLSDLRYARRPTPSARHPKHWPAVNRPQFLTSASNLAMLCIFRRSVALRPLTRIHQFSSILYHCPRPRYPNRLFSQSSQRPARPKKQYTPEQLAAFKNHYAALGLSNTATDRDIKTAYNKLSLRFHPDMMRNVDSKEYWDNPDRPEFIKVSTPPGAQSESTTVMPAEGKGGLSTCRTYLLTNDKKRSRKRMRSSVTQPRGEHTTPSTMTS